MAKRMAEVFEEMLQGVWRHLGYELARRPKVQGQQSYAFITPLARYCPWNTDAAFLDTYRAVRSHTLVDAYRCYELWQLVEQSRKLDGALIEIGVWRGGTGALIAQQAQRCGIRNPVYLCDTFTGVVKACGQDTTYKGGEHSDTSKAVVEELLGKRLHLENFQILEGVFPDDTGRRVEGEKFRFCHIDVDVYQSAEDIVAWIWDRMVIGGMVVYDDYGSQGCSGIRTHVEAQRLLSDRLVIYNLNGHAVIVKLK